MGITDLDTAFGVLIDGDRRRIDLGQASDRPFVNSCVAGLTAESSSETSPVMKDKLGVLAYVVTGLRSMSDFDAVEVNGKHPGNIKRVRKLADTLSLPIVGGSDAHYPFEVGRAFTRIEASRLTPETVVEAIQAGGVEPQLRSTSFDQAIQTAIRYIHLYR